MGSHVESEQRLDAAALENSLRHKLRMCDGTGRCGREAKIAAADNTIWLQGKDCLIQVLSRDDPTTRL